MTTTLPYQRKSRTSKAGAIAAAPGAESQWRQVVDYVTAHPNCTRAELGAALGWESKIYSRACWEAMGARDKHGIPTRPVYVVLSGERHCSRTGYLAGTLRRDHSVALPAPEKPESVAIAPPLKQGALQL